MYTHTCGNKTSSKITSQCQSSALNTPIWRYLQTAEERMSRYTCTFLQVDISLVDTSDTKGIFYNKTKQCIISPKTRSAPKANKARAVGGSFLIFHIGHFKNGRSVLWLFNPWLWFVNALEKFKPRTVVLKCHVQHTDNILVRKTNIFCFS